MSKDPADLSSAQSNVCMKVSRHCSSRVEEFHWLKCALKVLMLHVQSKDSWEKALRDYRISQYAYATALRAYQCQVIEERREVNDDYVHGTLLLVGGAIPDF